MLASMLLRGFGGLDFAVRDSGFYGRRLRGLGFRGLGVQGFRGLGERVWVRRLRA